MISILITGDFYPSYRVIPLIDRLDHQSIFNDLLPIIQQADCAIVNLEAPIADPAVDRKINKWGPHLHCSEKTVSVLKNAGFDLVTLANNHFRDYGDDGIRRTLTICEREGLKFVGGGRDILQASEVRYETIGGLRFAFLNFCEHEFSIADADHAGSNPLDPIVGFYQIKEARSHADYVLVIVHGGIEGYRYPTPRMQRVYRFFVDAGADIVVNHHQHCYSGYEEYGNSLIFYGLGNFSFDWPGARGRNWNEGFVLQLTFSSGKPAFTLHPYLQGDREPGIRLVSEGKRNSFDSHIAELNGIIRNEKSLNEIFEQHLAQVRDAFVNSFSPYTNKYLKALSCRRLIPSFISQKKLLHISNLVACESHCEVLIRALQQREGYHV